MEYIVLFLFGAIVGSFLNVLILRFNTGKTLLGRSMCMSCQKKLHWYELVPLLSFLFLKGRCRNCRVKISFQYFIVEFLSGVFAVLSFYLLGASLLAFLFFVYLLTLLFMSVYDIRHLVVPISVSWFFVVLSFIVLLVYSLQFDNALFLVGQNIAWAIFAFFIFYALWKLTKGKWVGLADAKIIFALGLVLSWRVIFVVYWAAVSCLVLIGLLWLIGYLSKFFGKKITTLNYRAQIPFVPFLFVGFLLETAFRLSDLYFSLIF